jgi:putative selenium metabolism protein SsnA
MLVIGNGTLITRDPANPFFLEGCVAIRGNKIIELGTTEALRGKYPEASFVDAQGRVIMPGLINTHMHCYSSFARGMDLKAQSPHEFGEILERLWWRLDKQLTLEDVYYSAAVAMIDCIKNGTTTIFDHHASPFSVGGSLFRMAEAAKYLGIRTCLCYEVSDRDGEEVAQQGVQENVDYIRECYRVNDPMQRALFGLHASFTLSDKLLRQSAEVAASLGVGCHIHTAEASSDVEACRRDHGKRVVERLNSFGILHPATIAAHGVHVNAQEIELLREAAPFVVHNPESNMGNAVGCAPVLEMVRQGVRVGLGSDGYTADMFESLKVTNLLHKHQQQDAAAAWLEPHDMLFERNADFASACFGQTLGRLSPGALADIIIVDYDPPTPMTRNNLDGHILFGMTGRSVVTTIINGRIVMRDRQMVLADAKEIFAMARSLAATLWQRF